jgi:uncharacterized protein YndB with AHSA1/START domain
MHSNTDRIEKRIELKAPVEVVWRALTDPEAFGEWFRVKLEGPFVPGQATRGKILHPGYEHLVMEVVTQRMEEEELFSFTWHPYAIDAKVDYSNEPPTLVEFILKPTPHGDTLLIVSESGFDQLPPERRDLAWRMNDHGWSAQVKNIEAYVAHSGET